MNNAFRCGLRCTPRLRSLLLFVVAHATFGLPTSSCSTAELDCARAALGDAALEGVDAADVRCVRYETPYDAPFLIRIRIAPEDGRELRRRIAHLKLS
ncbi:MAG: hypothetical protein RBU37_26390, partial [Myxococcota bacterium]|nr:hypothetical protein [Myxococcota bacterium]